jgi:hypothetical protein
MECPIFVDQGWYAEFLLKIDLKILLRKKGARLNFKIALYLCILILGSILSTKNLRSDNLPEKVRKF